MSPDPAIPGPARETPAEALAAIRRQRGHADRAVGWTVQAVALVPLLGGPAVATLVSPAVDSGAGVVGVFLSTFAFAAGVAAFVVVLRTGAMGSVAGWPLVLLAGLCLIGGLVLSGLLGMGAYTTPVVPASVTGTPIDLPLAFVTAAVTSWGVVGAVLSAASGVAAGFWGVRAGRAIA